MNSILIKTNSIITKITTFYLKYKLAILISLFIAGFALTTGCIIYVFLIKTIIVSKGVVISGVVASKFGPELHEEAFTTIKDVKKIVEEHAVNPVGILAEMCPANPLKDWLLAVHPKHILYDNMGRVYYVITESVTFEYFVQHLGMTNYTDITRAKQNLILLLDPTHYDAIHYTFRTARAAIKLNNEHLKIITDIICNESDLIKRWQAVLLMGAASGAGLALYALYKIYVG
jgi:hypothetical protein